MAIVGILAGLFLVETEVGRFGFVLILIGIWSGGLAIFARLFSRVRGGQVQDPREPASLVGTSPFPIQVLYLGIFAIWFLGLAVISCLVLYRLVT